MNKQELVQVSEDSTLTADDVNRIINDGLPTFEEYAGPSSLRVFLPEITLYYSYNTVVAFWHSKTGLVVRENDWSTTTGKHLNAINSNKSDRVPSVTFRRLLAEALNS